MVSCSYPFICIYICFCLCFSKRAYHSLCFCICCKQSSRFLCLPISLKHKTLRWLSAEAIEELHYTAVASIFALALAKSVNETNMRLAELAAAALAAVALLLSMSRPCFECNSLGLKCLELSSQGIVDVLLPQLYSSRTLWYSGRCSLMISFTP